MNAGYDSRGPQLRRVLLARLGPYADPENDRDLVIRQAVEAIEADVKWFERFCVDAQSDIGLLRLELQMADLSLSRDAIEAAIGAMPVVTTNTIPGANTVPRVDSEGFHTKLVVILARSIAMGLAVTRAQDVARALIAIHQTELERYLSESLSADIDAVLDTADEILADEARDKIVEEGLKAAAALAGVAAETLFPLAKIATIALDLHKGIKELKTRYRRGDVDDLFAFARRLRELNDVGRSDLKLLKGLPLRPNSPDGHALQA
ncbi:MAG: hypothetical protein IPJ77_11310 [Planctomycetes bacterium]|nr:hypothetical protein [Planctomycetota bacterium]